jgi:hypothetical protein
MQNLDILRVFVGLLLRQFAFGAPFALGRSRQALAPGAHQLD